MVIVYLVLLLLLAKIILIDSPLGQAMGDAIRNLVPQRVEMSSPSAVGIESLRREVEELRERLDRVVEEQLFLTELVSRPRQLNPGSGEAEGLDSPN